MEQTCELTILMPCLNESETLATCIMKAKAYLERSGVDGEVLIADNGSRVWRGPAGGDRCRTRQVHHHGRCR